MGEIKQSNIDRCVNSIEDLKKEISKVIVGQEEVINGLIRALLCNGHVLLEGIPGIAKTTIIRALSSSTNCKFKRVQFTPDLLPTDILGITSYEADKGFFVIKGPIFANFIIADEINRSPPKVQSALLEAMQEKQVTIGHETFPLDEPFFVFATQNPIETLGTYNLPEAQIDRFLFKLVMKYPSKEEEKKIIEQNITTKNFEDYKIKSVLSPKDIIEMQNMTKLIGHTDRIKEYIVDIVDSTRKPDKYGIKTGKYIELGSSPRASIALFIAAKADALLNKNSHIKPRHVKNIAFDVLRHRLILNYSGQVEGIKVEDIISEILSKVPIP